MNDNCTNHVMRLMTVDIHSKCKAVVMYFDDEGAEIANTACKALVDFKENGLSIISLKTLNERIKKIEGVIVNG